MTTTVVQDRMGGVKVLCTGKEAAPSSQSSLQQEKRGGWISCQQRDSEP